MQIESFVDILTLIISIIALCISFGCGLITLIHNIISVKPYCAIIERYHEHNLAIVIVNRGSGPLVIKSIDVSKIDIHRDNLIEFMPKVKQLWEAFSLEIRGRAVLPDHEITLCAIDPSSQEIRDQVLTAIADINVNVVFHDSYGRKGKATKTLLGSKIFINDGFGYRAK